MEKMGCEFVKRDDEAYAKMGFSRSKRAVDANLVKNENIDNSKAIKNCITHLKHGELVCIFPEGDQHVRSTYDRGNKNFLPAQTGFITIAELADRACKTQVPIIPVGIGFSIRNLVKLRLLSMSFGEPLYLSQLKAELNSKNPEALAEAVMSRIRGLSVYG